MGAWEYLISEFTHNKNWPHKSPEFYRVQLHKQILNVFSHPSLILEGGQVTGIGWCCSVRISQTLIRQGKMIIPNYPSV